MGQVTRRKRTPASFPQAERVESTYSGLYLTADSICDRCHEAMDAATGVRIVKWHGIWFHSTCVPGGDDE